MIGVLKLRPMIDAEQMVKIQRLMYKIIAFSLVYVLPMLIVMMCFIYDIVYRYIVQVNGYFIIITIFLLLFY